MYKVYKLCGLINREHILFNNIIKLALFNMSPQFAKILNILGINIILP